MTAPRLLVTGSRGWTHKTLMAQTLKEGYRSLKNDPDPRVQEQIILVSGNATGADTMAERLWSEKLNPEWIERYPAKDFGHPLKRNDHMISLGASLCLAFVLPCYKPYCQVERGFHYSHGAAYTADHAEAAGIKTIRVEDPTMPPF